MKVYISGKFFEKEDAKISVFDHGLLYGDGVFEGLRSYSGKVFRLQQHVDRLWDSAKGIMLEIPMSKLDVANAINQTLEVNGITDGYVRAVVTRGVGTLGLDAHLCRNPQVIIIADHLALYPKEYYQKGLEIVTASTLRNNNAAISPQIKSLNYLNNVLGKIEGHLAGCVEALMLNNKGEVAECTGDNIFIVKNNVLMTPGTDSGILEGITRGAVLEAAVMLGIPAQEKSLTRQDVYRADECFLTGSGAELIPVAKVDGRTIGEGVPGKFTLQLLGRFHEMVRQ